MSRNRRIALICGIFVVILAIIATIVFFVVGNKNEDTDLIIKENVKVITEETDYKYLPIGVDENSITFKNDPKYREGDVIVAGIIEEAPDGFIRKIIGTRKENNTFIYETEYAVLTDVFEEAHIIRSFAVTKDGVYEIENPDDVNMTINFAMGNMGTSSSEYSIQPMVYKKQTTSHPRSVQLLDMDRDLLFKGEIEKELNDFISVSGEFGFDVWFEVKIDIENGNIEFGIANHTKTEGEVFIGYEDEGEVEYSKPIFEKKLPNFQFTIGYVPVVITNDLEVRLEASDQIEGSIGITVDLGSERISGFEYNSKTGKVCEINEREYLGDGLEWDTSAKASGEGNVGIYANLITKLYGSTGADLDVGMKGSIEGEVFLGSDSESDEKYYGALALKVGPKAKGSVVVSVPIVDKKLEESPLFVGELPLFFDKKWEKTPKTPPVSYNNTYITNRAREYMVTCPEFAFEYSDNWKISQEELDMNHEWNILENERGVTVNYYESNQGFDSQYYGGGYTMRYAKITKVADCEFKPGYITGTDSYYSLGKFVVAKLEEYAREDGLNGGGKYEVDGMVAYAIVPESYLGEVSFKGNGFWAALAWDYPSPIAMLVTSPDETFTAQEEQEIIHMLSTFRETGDYSVENTNSSSVLTFKYNGTGWGSMDNFTSKI